MFLFRSVEKWIVNARYVFISFCRKVEFTVCFCFVGQLMHNVFWVRSIENETGNARYVFVSFCREVDTVD